MKRALVMMILSACLISANYAQAAPADENPQWIRDLIARFQREPVGSPPRSIWRYEYKGQTVYYVPAQCCDQFSQLFDAKGKSICAPNGGLSGMGDGKCPDFFKGRKNENLVWQDQRKR